VAPQNLGASCLSGLQRQAQRESTVDSTCFFTIAARNPKNKVELARNISGYFLAVSARWHIICQQVAGCLSGFHRQASVKIDFICMQSIKARVVFQKICSFSVYVLCLMFYVLHQQQVR
jgi:hypothetical protein